MNIHVRLDSTSATKRPDSTSGPFTCLPKKAGRSTSKIEDSYKTSDRLRVSFTLPRSVRAGDEVKSRLRLENWGDFEAFSIYVDVECRAKIFLEGKEDDSKENLVYFQRFVREKGWELEKQALQIESDPVSDYPSVHLSFFLLSADTKLAALTEEEISSHLVPETSAKATRKGAQTDGERTTKAVITMMMTESVRPPRCVKMIFKGHNKAQMKTSAARTRR